MSYFCQNQQRGHFSTSSVNVTNSIKYSIYMLVYNKSYLIKENGSILTQLKSMRPLPAHWVTVPPLPLCCAVHNLLMIVIIPSDVYFCISQQQRPGRWPCWRRACSTAALQHCKHWQRAACSAAAPGWVHPDSTQRGPAPAAVNAVTLHAYCSTAARTQDTHLHRKGAASVLL